MSARNALLRTLLRTPGLAVTYHDVLAQLAHAATARTFGVIDEDRRAVLRHGYLLAPEDVEREMRLAGWKGECRVSA